MTQPTRVLFVCLGNICRSPIAEGVFRDLAESAGVAEHYAIDSAGTSGYHAGELPNVHSIGVCDTVGIDLREQRSRALTRADVVAPGYVIAMDRTNLSNINRLGGDGAQSTRRLLLDYGRADVVDVPDPYYGGRDGFVNVLKLIQGACDGLFEELERERSVT